MCYPPVMTSVEDVCAILGRLRERWFVSSHML